MLENQDELFPPIHESETELCVALWVSVALQMVVDARSNGKKDEAQHDKRSALNWLRAREEDKSEFAMVCHLAGLDFKKTQKRFWEIVTNPEETADFRCIKKALLENRGLELRSKYLSRMRRQENARQQQRARRLAEKAIPLQEAC